jgi:hypothetical protein
MLHEVGQRTVLLKDGGEVVAGQQFVQGQRQDFVLFPDGRADDDDS